MAKKAIFEPRNKRPDRGFFEHFKNKPYEVLGVGYSNESDCHDVVYRPLYPFDSIINGIRTDFILRPIEMFMSVVPDGEMRIPRFRTITNRTVCQELSAVRTEMYPPDDNRIEFEPASETMECLQKIAALGILGKTPSQVAKRLIEEHVDL